MPTPVDDGLREQRQPGEQFGCIDSCLRIQFANEELFHIEHRSVRELSTPLCRELFGPAPDDALNTRNQFV